MPSEEEFPFTVRVTADTLSSSGSSSMAAVCAASLALHTAGVPTAALAAGISVGLVTDTPPQLGALATATSDRSSSGGSNGQQQQGEGGGCGVDAGSYSSFVAVGFKAPTAGEGVEGNTTGQLDADSSSSSDSSSGDEAGSSSSSDDDGDDKAAVSSSSSSNGAGVGEVSGGVLGSSYGRALLLTDIQGMEDHLGDMDFKVGRCGRVFWVNVWWCGLGRRV